jgi:hypothetical protein
LLFDYFRLKVQIGFLVRLEKACKRDYLFSFNALKQVV